MNASAIEKIIKSAFKSVTLEDGIGLYEAQALDDRESSLTQARARLRDEKEDWGLLSHEDLAACHSSLSFFDANGMRFHLPAFIIAHLHDSFDDPLYHLTRLDEFALEKLSTLNGLQKTAVTKYLYWCLEQDSYVYEHPSIEKAVMKFWDKQ